MDRFLIAVVLIVVAVVIALVVQRRRSAVPDAPTQPAWTVPTQLDRHDFIRAETPWLVVVFTASTCDMCRGVWEKAQLLDAREVAVQEVEVTADREIHSRYGIDAVPLVLVADSEGVVRAHFLGPVTATDLWARVAELREPGTISGDCQSRAVES